MPLSGTTGPVDLTKWAVFNGLTFWTPTAVNVAGGQIRLSDNRYTGSEPQLVYFGPPPYFTTAQGGWLHPFTGVLWKP